MKHWSIITAGMACFLGFSLTLVADASAQRGGRGAQQGGAQAKVKELIEAIRKEMAEIDKLLNRARVESSRRSGASGSQKSKAVPTLQESLSKNKVVIEKIDELLSLARDNAKQRRQNERNRNRQRQQGERQNRQQPRDRRQDSPDMMQQDQGDPDNPGVDPKTGKQLTKPKKPKNIRGQKFDRAKVEKAWGELPPYLQEIFKKGGSPAVPSKYRNFEEEFHKKADRNHRKK